MAAVSYTHLDVYKRQVDPLTGQLSRSYGHDRVVLLILGGSASIHMSKYTLSLISVQKLRQVVLLDIPEEASKEWYEYQYRNTYYLE